MIFFNPHHHRFLQLWVGFYLSLIAAAAPIVFAQESIVATPVVAKRPVFAKLFSKAKPSRSIIKAKPVAVSHSRKVSTPSSGNSLSELIAEALSNNPELHSARQDEIIQLAKSEYTQSAGKPQLLAYGTHDSQPGAVVGAGRSERDALGLSFEQPLYDFGSGKRRLDSEINLAQSHRWQAKVKELEIVYQVTETYWRLVFLDEVIRLRTASLHAKRAEQSSIADRVSARESRYAELLLAKAGVAEAEQALFVARNGRNLAHSQLQFFLGRDQQSSIHVRDRLSRSQFAAAVTNESLCIQSHPEIKRALAAETAARNAENSARAGRLPKVFLRGHIEDSQSQLSQGTTNVVPDGTNYQVGAYMSVPMGRQRSAANAKLNEAQATRIQLAADLETLNASLRLRVKDARNRVEEAAKSVTVSEHLEAAAFENFKLRKELAMIKNATRADVASAEKDYLDARVAVYKARYDLKKALAHLQREVGRVN